MSVRDQLQALRPDRPVRSSVAVAPVQMEPDDNPEVAVPTWEQVLAGRGELTQGMRGEGVKALQRLLSEAGFPTGADGIFGPGTARRVRELQEATSLEASGRVGKTTAEALVKESQVPHGRNNAGVRIRLEERLGHKMLPVVAAAVDRLRGAAAADGVDLIIRDGFRSYDEQVEIAARLGLYSEGGLAARPGTSNHGMGRALDLDDGQGYSWLLKNARDYGWEKTVPREDWHWEYWGD